MALLQKLTLSVEYSHVINGSLGALHSEALPRFVLGPDRRHISLYLKVIRKTMKSDSAASSYFINLETPLSHIQSCSSDITAICLVCHVSGISRARPALHNLSNVKKTKSRTFSQLEHIFYQIHYRPVRM